MTTKRPVGLHVRTEKSFTSMLTEALSCGVNSCQFFFLLNNSDHYLRLSKTDQKEFLHLRQEHNMTIYAHSSYWINLATGDPLSSQISRDILEKEIYLARKLKIDTLIVHAGSAKKFPKNPADPASKQAGIAAVAKILNYALKHEDITILLENTAHGNKTVGSNLHDFKILKSLLEKPNQVKYCLDTAHAFAYGYNLEATEEFITLLDTTLGIENIKLIHFNDSDKACGSKIDHHTLPGQGIIGKQTLLKLINHPKLCHLPLIIEPPALSIEKIKEGLTLVKQFLVD